jgi:hypothetical protein
MSNLKTFLKVAQKLGYPNPNPDSYTIAKSIDYSLRNLIDDLLKEVGREKTNEFIEKTFSKLGAMSSPGIKIDLGDRAGEEGSYIYLIINSFGINEGDEDVEVVWINYTWGDSLIIDDEGEKTLEDIWDDVDMGSWGEYDDFLDEIRYECQEKIFRQTGIGIHFDSQI